MPVRRVRQESLENSFFLMLNYLTIKDHLLKMVGSPTSMDTAQELTREELTFDEFLEELLRKGPETHAYLFLARPLAYPQQINRLPTRVGLLESAPLEAVGYDLSVYSPNGELFCTFLEKEELTESLPELTSSQKERSADNFYALENNYHALPRESYEFLKVKKKRISRGLDLWSRLLLSKPFKL